MQSIHELRNTLVEAIVNPVLLLLFSIGLLVFVFGVVEFMWGVSRQTDKRKEGKQHMLYGLMGMFIMVSAAAIVNVIMNTFPVPSTTNTMGNIFDDR